MKRFFMTSVSVLWAFASPSFTIEGSKLLKAIDANLNPETFEMYRKLINVEPGSKRNFEWR